jgi:excisionase family DNA binding protein
MASDLVGLPEAAQSLGVHYMTAYRYVRTGRLPARSVGGLWQVDPADIEALKTKKPLRRRKGGARATAAAAFEERLIDGDEGGAYEICESAMTAWASPVDIYVDVLVPSLRSIGLRWADGELSVADEHRAAAVASRIIGRLGPRFVHPGRRRGTVVVGAPAGDRHAIPVAVVSDLLRHRGYAVIDLGADTPPGAFVEAARSADRLGAVAVGSTLRGNAASITATVSEVHRALPGIPVIVGGAGLVTARAAQRTGSDYWSGTDGRMVVARMDDLSRTQVSRPSSGGT